jgi:hypothetical protein
MHALRSRGSEEARGHVRRRGRDLVRFYGTSLFVMGTATVGIATYLYFTARKPEILGQTALVPTLGGDAVGLAVTGGF